MLPSWPSSLPVTFHLPAELFSTGASGTQPRRHRTGPHFKSLERIANDLSNSFIRTFINSQAPRASKDLNVPHTVPAKSAKKPQDLLPNGGNPGLGRHIVSYTRATSLGININHLLIIAISCAPLSSEVSVRSKYEKKHEKVQTTQRVGV